MAKSGSKGLEQAGSVELLRALGHRMVQNAKVLPGQMASRAKDLVAAGGDRADQAICAAVRKHLAECPPCRKHAARLDAPAVRKAPSARRKTKA